MKIQYFRSILAGLLAILFAGSAFNTAPIARAQSLQYWSDPVNLSNSGSSTDPLLVVDAEGMIRVVWADAIAGYKYVESADGKVWSSPKLANFPFLLEDNPRPAFFSNAAGITYVLWQDTDNNLYYGQTQSEFLSNSASWSQRSKVADSVVDYHGVVDSQGTLHLVYVKNLGGNSSPAGVYYSQLGNRGAPKTENLYSSEYFRSLDSTSAHVRIAISNIDAPEQIYVVWDDRPQKRILLTKSIDEGENWEEAVQILGPEAVSGLAMAFNAEIGVIDEQVLLTWQIGQPGEQCTQYSQWSKDGSGKFGDPVKISDQFPLCPQSTQFILQDEDFSIALYNVLDDMAFVAWNGSDWSEPQTQSEIAAFLNPVTLDSVIFGCQQAVSSGSILYAVGCDKGNGGDIWFSSRSLGTVDDWFPDSSAWSTAVEVTSADEKISALSMIADAQNNIHAFWVQTPLLDGQESTATVQYARWNGHAWSSSMPVRARSDGNPLQLTVEIDSLERLLLAWVDSKTGDIVFNSTSVTRALEWQSCQCIPSPSQANSSPDLLVDGVGRIILAYAIPINEQRGIYVVASDDGGLTWTEPLLAFDAASIGWESVDQPNIGLTGDGRLHVLFTRYALQGGQRQSLGLYYSHSPDGGVTWTSPEPVSENAVLWSAIVAYDRSIVHRLWQEKKAPIIATFHQVSQDGGLTWGRPATVSTISADSNLVAQTVEQGGQVHLLQLNRENNLIIQDQMWNGSGWVSQPTKELYIKERGVPSSIAASITSNGDLLVAVSADYPFLIGELKTNILSVGKSVELPQDIQPAAAGIIPTAGSTPTLTEEASSVLQPPTQNSSPAGLSDSPSFWAGKKNLVGFLLVGGLLVLVISVLLRGSRKQNTPKKIT